MPRVLPDDVFPTLGIVNPNWDMIDLHLIEPLLFDFSWDMVTYGPMFSVNPVPRSLISRTPYQNQHQILRGLQPSNEPMGQHISWP